MLLQTNTARLFCWVEYVTKSMPFYVPSLTSCKDGRGKRKPLRNRT